MRSTIRNIFFILLLTIVALMLIVGCDNNESGNGSDDNGNNDDPGDIPTGLLTADDLVYLGAFRLPNGVSDVKSWIWGGTAMTYYPGGDASGAQDGYPGSLYAAGHAWEHQVSEVTIPVPVNSATKNVNELNCAATLQQFQDILNVSNLEIPRTGLAYLESQGAQTVGKLHFCWGYHMQEEPPDLTHGWCELNLTSPGIQRGWYLSGHPVYIQNMSANDYLFEIPKSWADQYTSGMRLATGRYRDGGWSGQGPALFAIGPWNHGNPPSSGTGIDNTPLLLYTSTMEQEGGNTMNNYHHSDEWSGGVWLTAGDKAAVIFVGTKGAGDCWYGNQNGPCMNCDDRGWWSTRFVGQIIFYDPSDLAKVASGQMQPYEPQPYLAMNIDQHLYNITSTQQKHHLGACAFDRDNGMLYILEFRADDDKPLVHIWKVNQ